MCNKIDRHVLNKIIMLSVKCWFYQQDVSTRDHMDDVVIGLYLLQRTSITLLFDLIYGNGERVNVFLFY